MPRQHLRSYRASDDGNETHHRDTMPYSYKRHGWTTSTTVQCEQNYVRICVNSCKFWPFCQNLAILPSYTIYTSVKHGVTVMTFSTFLAWNCTKCQENRVDFQQGGFFGEEHASDPASMSSCLRHLPFPATLRFLSFTGWQVCNYPGATGGRGQCGKFLGTRRKRTDDLSGLSPNCYPRCHQNFPYGHVRNSGN